MSGAAFDKSQDDEGMCTHSSNEEYNTEEACRRPYDDFLNPDGTLNRESCVAPLARAQGPPPGTTQPALPPPKRAA